MVQGCDEARTAATYLAGSGDPGRHAPDWGTAERRGAAASPGGMKARFGRAGDINSLRASSKESTLHRRTAEAGPRSLGLNCAWVASHLETRRTRHLDEKRPKHGSASTDCWRMVGRFEMDPLPNRD